MGIAARMPLAALHEDDGRDHGWPVTASSEGLEKGRRIARTSREVGHPARVEDKHGSACTPVGVACMPLGVALQALNDGVRPSSLGGGRCPDLGDQLVDIVLGLFK